MLHLIKNQSMECVGVFTATGAAYATVSDHHSIFGRYVLPSVQDSIQTPLVKTSVKDFVELSLTDQVLSQRFAKEFDGWLVKAPKWSDGHEAGTA